MLISPPSGATAAAVAPGRLPGSSADSGTTGAAETGTSSKGGCGRGGVGGGGEGVGFVGLVVTGVAGDIVTAMLGTDSTVMPSTAEAAARSLRAISSELCTASAVVEAGTPMVAVMMTLAAARLIVTSDASTPALAAILPRRAEVSE